MGLGENYPLIWWIAIMVDINVEVDKYIPNVNEMMGLLEVLKSEKLIKVSYLSLNLWKTVWKRVYNKNMVSVAEAFWLK